MHRYKRVVGLVTILIVFIFGLSQIARAAVTYVVNVQTDILNGGCTADDCSLREAITAANANPGSDTIVLPAGIYALTRRGTGEDAANAGDLDITDSVTIVGESAALTIIDGTFPGNGGGYDRVLDVGPNSVTISVRVSDLTIRNVNVTSYNGAGVNNGVNASLTLDRVRLVNNRSTLSGGGIYNLGSVTLNGSTVDMNYSFVTGSAFYNAANASMSINSSTIMNNTAGNGGAAIDNWGMMSLANSTVSGNNAPIWGGVVSRGTFTATNATIVNNSSGVYNINTTLFSLRNTIVALNNNNNCVGTLTSLDYNLIGQTNCSLTGTTTHNLVGVNPNIGTLTDNGGPTSTHALQAGSPAINAGDPANCPSTDQRGALRSVCDIGAYEAVNAPELFPPSVVSVSSPLRTIDEGGQYSDGIAQLLVNFNEQLQDVSGDTDPNDVTNPANYQLIMAGSNDSLQTSVCGPLQGDDSAVAINSVIYNNISFQAALNLNGAAPLGNENYRLIVCSAGLKDTDGNQLDGNFDHIAGYDFVRNFRLQSVLETPQTNPFTVNITSDGNDGMCSTTNCTLRDAVIAANNYPGGGAVINIPAGTYTIMLPGTDETFAATGDLDIRASMTINGASRNTTIIDGNALDRIY
jgi:CSLREA domain-containing protein